MARGHATSALEAVAAEEASVLLVGMEDLGEQPWAVLTAAGIRLVRVADVADALRALEQQAAQVVIVGAHRARALTDALRRRRDLESAHVVVCAALDAPSELREALDAGADDVMRVPFAREVLAARVAAGLRAARLRASEALLGSLVANIPGAVYRCACDEHWTMEWLSDEIEAISGYPASDFIRSAVRTFVSVIHPDDRDHVARSVMDGVERGRPYGLEYRIVRRDGGVRWVLERGQAQDVGDGRR
jgi:PAS domain S-box-containing protein